jgi:hypothetical protein
MQFVKNVSRKNGDVAFGIYNSYSVMHASTCPFLHGATFIVDGNRTNFYGQFHTTLALDSTETIYFYANKPNPQTTLDPNPAETNDAIVKLLNSIKTAHTVSVGLYGAPDTYFSKYFTPEELLSLQDYCNKVLDAIE